MSKTFHSQKKGVWIFGFTFDYEIYLLNLIVRLNDAIQVLA